MDNKAENINGSPTTADERISQLLSKAITAKLSVPEEEELNAWLKEDKYNQRVFDLLSNRTILLKHLEFFKDINNEDEFNKAEERVFVRRQKKVIFRYLAYAASFLVITCLGLLYAVSIFSNSPSAVTRQTEIQPGGSKAILSFDNGEVMSLDQVSDGNIATNNGTTIQKQDGELNYSMTTDTRKGIVYNTITTPRGGSYRLKLSDGTHAWLNAASSIRFPVVFRGNERKVTVSGEVYFEVAKMPQPHSKKGAMMAFKVAVKDRDMEVEVLGTHFNINAYSNEDSVSVTLLEGLVKINTLKAHIKITPGEQARSKSSGVQVYENGIDINSVIAWKEEKFDFRSADLKSILRQVERWYDVDVVYLTEVPATKFRWKKTQTRNSNLSKVLEVLENSGVVFKIEGKKVMVSYPRK